MAALFRCRTRQEHVDESVQRIQRGDGQPQFEDTPAVLLFQSDEKRESAEQIVFSPELVDEDEAYGSLGQPCGERCAYRSPAEAEDKERVEQDIHHKSRSADVERCLAAPRGVVDTREGGGEEDERQCRRYDAQIRYGILGDMRFQLEKAHDGSGENKQQSAPAYGDKQCDADVVRGEGTCVFPVLRSDGLAYADFRPYLVQQGDRA